MPTKKTAAKPHPDITVCSPREMAYALSLLSRSQMQALAALSGIPFTTLYKRRAGVFDMKLSTAHHVAEHLPSVHRLKLPEKGAYQVWKRQEFFEALRLAREKT